MRIDLHVHSTFSDGVHTPTELLKMAEERGVGVLSIADHDCVDGLEDAALAASGKDIEVISGVELSSEFRGRDLHILGYGFDPGSGLLNKVLQKFRDTRQKRGIKIIEKLKGMGVELDPKEVLAKSADGSLGRPHIAEALIDRGYVNDHAQAFARYLGEHSPAYVKKHKLMPKEAIQYIRSAGGLAFVAHPGNYLTDGIHELIAFGFDGIEIIHPHHGGDEVKELRFIAVKYGLLMSGGTDYHGFSGKDLPIGELDVPIDLWEGIKRELKRRQ